MKSNRDSDLFYILDNIDVFRDLGVDIAKIPNRYKKQIIEFQRIWGSMDEGDREDFIRSVFDFGLNFRFEDRIRIFRISTLKYLGVEVINYITGLDRIMEKYAGRSDIVRSLVQIGATPHPGSLWSAIKSRDLEYANFLIAYQTETDDEMIEFCLEKIKIYDSEYRIEEKREMQSILFLIISCKKGFMYV